MISPNPGAGSNFSRPPITQIPNNQGESEMKKAHVSEEVIKTRVEEARRVAMITGLDPFFDAQFTSFKGCLYQTAFDYAEGIGDARFLPREFAEKCKEVFLALKSLEKRYEYTEEWDEIRRFFVAAERFARIRVFMRVGLDCDLQDVKTELDSRIDWAFRWEREELVPIFLFLCVRAKIYWSAIHNVKADGINDLDEWK